MYDVKSDFYKSKNNYQYDFPIGAACITFAVLALPVTFFTFVGMLNIGMYCTGISNDLLWLLPLIILTMTPFVLYWIPKTMRSNLRQPTIFKVASLSIFLSGILYAIPLAFSASIC